MNLLENERSLSRAVLELGAQALATRCGEFALHFFRDLASGRIAMLLAKGDLAAGGPMLARVHSACLTSECLMGCDCDCAEQLESALARIDAAGRGLVVYLMQEGRGAGISAKARDRMLVQASGNRITTFDAYAEMGLPPDLRRYDVVAALLALQGVRGPLRLMTNNPDKRLAVARALADEKIEVEGASPVRGRETSFNRDYLRAKRSAGHALHRPDAARGERPPERVVAFAPVALAADSERWVTAAYWIPIVLDGVVEWFRANVLVERASGRESIVLTRRTDEAPARIPLPAVDAWTALSLLDRLPIVESAGRASLARALRRLRDGGLGSVGVTWDETLLPALVEPAAGAATGAVPARSHAEP